MEYLEHDQCYRPGNESAAETEDERDFSYHSNLWAEKRELRIAYGRPTGEYKGRQPNKSQDKIFCVNGFKESFDADEAERHHITRNAVVESSSEEEQGSEEESTPEEEQGSAEDEHTGGGLADSPKLSRADLLF